MKVTLNGKNYTLDVENAKKFGLLLEEDDKCRSWEDFCDKYKKEMVYHNDDLRPYKQLTIDDSNALHALAKLMNLYRDWVKDWTPTFESDNKKYLIKYSDNELQVTWTIFTSGFLIFPSKEIADEFLSNFRDIIEKCKFYI
jgi:hypothetical protein